MSYRGFLTTTVYGVMLCGWGAIWIAERMDPAMMLVVLAAILLGIRGDRTGRYWVKPTWNRFLLVVGLGLTIADWRWGSRSWFLAIVMLLLYVGAVRAMAPKANRDLQQMIGLGFLQLLAASVLTLKLAYAFFFLAFFIMAPWALFAVAVKAELEGEYDMLQGAVAQGGPLETPLGADRLLSRGLLAAMLVAIALMMLVTTAFFMAFPRMHTGMISGRLGMDSARSGFSEDVRLGGMGSILEDSSPAARLVPDPPIRDPESIYLRGIALAEFDGKTWRYRGDPQNIKSHDGLYLEAERARPRHRMRIVMEDMGTNLLLLPQRPVRVKTPAPRYEVDHVYGVVRVPRFQGGFRYEVEYNPDAYWRNVDWRSLTPLTAADIPEAYRDLTQLPEAKDIPAEIMRYADATDLGWMGQAMNEFRNFSYTLELPGDDLPLHQFFERRAGHCEMFATSLALMLRAAGIPAVVVNGFRGAEPMGDGYLLVRQRNAHSWVEVWHPAIGDHFVPLDPTPPLPPAFGWRQKMQETWQRGFDWAWFFWMDRVVSYDYAIQRDVVRQGRQSAMTIRDAFTAVQGTLRDWVQAVGAVIVGAGIALFVLLTSWFLYLLARRGRSRRQDFGWRRTPGWMRRVLRRIEIKYGKRPAHLPLAEWARQDRMPPDVQQFFHDYEAWRYSDQTSSRVLRQQGKKLLGRK